MLADASVFEEETTGNRSLRKSVTALTLSCVALLAFWNIATMSSSVLITLLTFNAIRSSIAEIYCSKVGGSILTPLKAAAICRVNKETERVLSYSRIRLAIASPYITGILCVSAVARGCLIVGKDSSEGNVEETFVDRLVKANWYCSRSIVESILEVSGDEEAGDFGCISLRLFCCIRGCDRMEFGACFLFIRGPNSRILEGCFAGYRYCS
jgi:hypothetical protein